MPPGPTTFSVTQKVSGSGRCRESRIRTRTTLGVFIVKALFSKITSLVSVAAALCYSKCPECGAPCNTGVHGTTAHVCEQKHKW